MNAFTETEESDIGNIFEDIGDAVGDVAKGAVKGVTSVVDAIGDVVKAIPGGEWILDGVGTVTGAVGDFVTGPMRDFARTAVGETIFRAASVAMSQALYVVPGVGYALGFSAWAVPGLAKGDGFDAALTKEFIYRCEKVAEVFAGKLGEQAAKQMTDIMGKQLKTATTKLGELAKQNGVSIQAVVDKLGMTPDKLATMLGIRQDVAAYAIAWAQRKGEAALATIAQLYDPETGALRPTKRLGKKVVPPTKVVSLGKKAVPVKISPASMLAKTTVGASSPIQKTIAAQTAVAQAEASANPDAANAQIIAAAEQVADTRSTKLGLAAGLAGAVLGTGGALLAGLSATIAAPVGIGFGVGSGVVTKLLSRRK